MKTKELLSFVLLAILFSACFAPLTKATSASIPRYGVNYHFEEEYPSSASVLADLREGGVYWVRTDMYNSSLLASFWSDMKKEGIKVLGLLTSIPLTTLGFTTVRIGRRTFRAWLTRLRIFRRGR